MGGCIGETAGICGERIGRASRTSPGSHEVTARAVTYGKTHLRNLLKQAPITQIGVRLTSICLADMAGDYGQLTLTKQAIVIILPMLISTQ